MLDTLARYSQAIRDIPLIAGGAGELRPFCTANGWYERTPESGYFTIEAPVELVAATSEDDEACPARVVLHRWEDWDVEDHPSKAEYAKAVQAFDDLYNRAHDVLSRSWGTAIARGGYRIEGQRHRWAMWPGAGGLRILAQDEPDIQLGVELDIWLVPWREGQDLPDMPLF
jgi:hypothetical protein